MAAGLGFKTFTTGEVLTAADTNGYLMQGVLVFASAAARSAAITSPQEGQYSYLKDTNSTEYYDGAAWVAGVEGDISGVTAGTGISGGGTSGTVTVTNSMATAIDAKGDLIPGTGADTFARLAVGANDLILTAASGETTGLKYSGAWTSYTPTLYSITAGNGTLAAKYAQVGKICFVNFSFTLGSTSSVSTSPGFSLPVNGVQTATYANGNALLLDAATAEYYGIIYLENTGKAVFYAQNASGTYLKDATVTATVPMTWGTSDKFTANFWYEVA